MTIEGTRSRRTRQRRSQRRGRAVLLVAVVVVLGLVAGGAYGVWNAFGPAQDYSGSGSGQVDVTLPAGASLTRIGSLLAESDVVASTKAFVEAAQSDAKSSSIGPGTYAMALKMSGSAAVERLLDPSARVTARVLVREGDSIREITAEIVDKTTITSRQVEAALAAPQKLGLPAYAKDRPEGFLFPATYDVDAKDTATTLLQAMVQRFNEVSVEIGFEAKAADIGVDPYDAMIVASLVQAEAAPVDYPKVSRVVFNRLDQRMRLQFDSTVNYALGRSKVRLNLDDLKVDSPYNTYRVAGLPPTPLDSPSREALLGAVTPDDGPWIYFVTTDLETQTTKFTDSYEEFLTFKAEFKASLS